MSHRRFYVLCLFTFFLFLFSLSPVRSGRRSHHQRTATVQAWTRTRVARGTVRASVCDALDVVHREPILVLRSGRVRGDGRVPANQLLVVQRVEDFDLHPRTQRLPDWHGIRRSKIDEVVILEALRSAGAEEDGLA